MAIGLLIGSLIGFLLGLAFAIWLVTVAGYGWRQVMHRWRIELVYRRHKAEIDTEVEVYRILADSMAGGHDWQGARRKHAKSSG